MQGRPSDKHVVNLQVTVAHSVLVQLGHALKHAEDRGMHERTFVVTASAEVLREWLQQWKVELARSAVIPEQPHDTGHASFLQLHEDVCLPSRECARRKEGVAQCGLRSRGVS